MTELGGDRGVSVTTLDRWRQWMAAAGHSPATIGTRTRTVRALMNQAGVTDLTEVTREHCVEFLSRDLARWTRLSYYRSIEKLSTFLREYDIDPTSDLTRGIPRPRTPHPVARPIDDETINRILTVQLSPRARAYVTLALLAGLRVHEVAKIRGEDVDLAAGWLRVVGKGGYEAVIPMHAEVRRLAESMPAYGPWFPSWVDPTRSVNPHAVTDTIRNVLRAVGSPATPHMLRDTFATKIQREVRDLRVTQSLLRHRSVRSTQKYVAVSDRDLQRAVDSLDWQRDAA